MDLDWHHFLGKGGLTADIFRSNVRYPNRSDAGQLERRGGRGAAMGREGTMGMPTCLANPCLSALGT
jgi:hypothetical protein